MAASALSTVLVAAISAFAERDITYTCTAAAKIQRAYAPAALPTTAGDEVATSEVECCGMAGSFGYKTEYYELSVDVGERLREQYEAAGGLPVASGTSCRDQFDALVDRRAPHPIELLAPEGE